MSLSKMAEDAERIEVGLDGIEVGDLEPARAGWSGIGERVCVGREGDAVILCCVCALLLRLVDVESIGVAIKAGVVGDCS